MTRDEEYAARRASAAAEKRWWGRTLIWLATMTLESMSLPRRALSVIGLADPPSLILDRYRPVSDVRDARFRIILFCVLIFMYGVAAVMLTLLVAGIYESCIESTSATARAETAAEARLRSIESRLGRLEARDR